MQIEEPEVDGKVESNDNPTQPRKRLFNRLNPIKAVIGGITQRENGLNNVGGKLNKVPSISQGVSIFADYHKLLYRGNVIDLAVAVVIGAAFASVGFLDSLVKDIISPIVSLASGKALKENFIIPRNDSKFTNSDVNTTEGSSQASNTLSWNYGNFIQTVINVCIISACVFIVIKLYQMGRNTKVAVTEKKYTFCFGSVELQTVRCSECTSWLDMDKYAKSEEVLP
ncbi:hypothetical protein BGZ92_001512 [Podila epicladia]|nr:hypothetical protein BGZ92_001512 [Podila epicladia]